MGVVRYMVPSWKRKGARGTDESGPRRRDPLVRARTRYTRPRWGRGIDWRTYAITESIYPRTAHRLERLDGGGTRVTYRMEITGPAADEMGPQVGPAITADFPETMAALVALALAR